MPAVLEQLAPQFDHRLQVSCPRRFLWARSGFPGLPVSGGAGVFPGHRQEESGRHHQCLDRREDVPGAERAFTNCRLKHGSASISRKAAAMSFGPTRSGTFGLIRACKGTDVVAITIVVPRIIL